MRCLVSSRIKWTANAIKKRPRQSEHAEGHPKQHYRNATVGDLPTLVPRSVHADEASARAG